MTADEVIERALEAVSAADKRGGIPYALGQGGMTPSAPFPWTIRGLDCTGWCAWALGISRKDSRIPGGWIESTAIVADGNAPGGLFTRVDEALPGDLLVWGDSVVNGKKREGHAGLVIEALNGHPLRVAHCSKSNYSNTRNALLVTAPDIFARHGAVVVRFNELDAPAAKGRKRPADQECVGKDRVS
jgi:cell wall-associated NlpC family hydrolase